MKFCGNTYDPKAEDARTHVALSFDEFNTPGGVELAWQRYLEWLSDKVIMDPKATESYTVAELKAMGMVGVYKSE